jgi:hypothetical protein
MKRPRWINVIGILMIIFAVFRFSSSWQMMITPGTIEELKETLDKISSDTVTSIDETFDMGGIKVKVKEDSISQSEDIDWLRSIIGYTTKPSKYFLKWVRPLGISGMVVMILYLAGGVILLMARPISPVIAYFTLGISVVFYILVFFIMLSDPDDSYLSVSMAINRVIAIPIDLAILLYLIGAEKDYFRRKEIEV